ncbi:putative galacturonosyltransferase 14-like [Capsicum annuum]|nr:putative galacturonosyltransferase 14-like [Capsicum annuum]
MASHHHYHHPYPTAATTNPTTPITTICYCYSCHPTPTPTPTPTPYPHPPPPNPHSTPHYTHYPPPHPHLCTSHPTPYNPPTQCQCEPFHQNHHHFQEFKVTDQQTDSIVTSLLRRIAALESSLRRTSSPPRTRQTLRDAAARTIQTHFRAFLARRSRTLRLLKQLASIKTTLYVLKSLVSGKTHFDARAVKHKALDLLVRLDSIEGDDPLIRDGKRSISNELARFVKAINGVTIISSRVVKNVGGGYKARVFSTDRKIEFDTNRSEAIDKFVASVNESEDEEEEEEDQQNTRLSDTEKSGILLTRCGGLAGSHGGVKPKRKKSVTFAENGGAYRVFHSSPEPASVGNVHEKESFDDEIELIKNLNKRVEKLGMASKDCQVAEQEDSESSGSSDNERDPNQISRKDGYYERNVRDENDNEIENESFLFSAPLPVKMEGRAADHINRKKGVKIVGN